MSINVMTFDEVNEVSGADFLVLSQNFSNRGIICNF